MSAAFERACAELAAALEAEIAAATSSARSEAAEGWNLTLRQIRRSAAASEALALLVQEGAKTSERAALIEMEGDEARVSVARGFEPRDLRFSINEAAAVVAAVETQDPVTASATESEFSAALYSAALSGMDISRAHLFPVRAGGTVRALLFAAGEVAGLELLCEAVGMRLEALDSQAKPAAWEWKELSPEVQAVHIRAQRFARVAVAQIRMNSGAALRDGQWAGNVYESVKPEIDAARDTYRKEFSAAAPGMVDYLYLEFVRNLANDDDSLLGPDFPGPLH